MITTFADQKTLPKPTSWVKVSAVILLRMTYVHIHMTSFLDGLLLQHAGYSASSQISQARRH